MSLKVENPKFNFTEEQTRDILMAAYHLNKVAEYLQSTNGMLSLIYNAQVAELLNQIGMLQSFENRESTNETKLNEIKLSESELKEIDDIFKDINDTDIKNDTKKEATKKPKNQKKRKNKVKDDTI